MKLQVLRWTAAVIFAILFPFVFTQKDRYCSAMPGGETYGLKIHRHIEELECSIQRSFVWMHNLIFADNYSLVVPPDKPENLSISDSGSTWVHLQWKSQFVSTESVLLLRYDIIVTNSKNGTGYVVPYNSMNINSCLFNVTGLQHNTPYAFSVTAVSEKCGAFARSRASNIVHSTTKLLDRVETFPVSGTLIAGFEEEQIASTLICNAFSDNQQMATKWSTGNIRNEEIQEVSMNSASLSLTNEHYNNKLVIRCLRSDLDNIVVYCGTNETPKLANFTIRLYSPPVLEDKLLIKIPEYTTNISIDLGHKDYIPFPEPLYFALKKEAHFLSNHGGNTIIKLNSSMVHFQNISRSHSGNYSMIVTNYALPFFKMEVGTFTSNFEVDVLYGPEFSPGLEKHYVLYGDPVSLICGYDLESNPPPTITWTNPYNKSVVNTDMYVIDNGPQVIQLNITNARESDSGLWICHMEVHDKCVHRIIEGVLTEDCNTNTCIGYESFHTQLVVLVRPSNPYNLKLVDCGLTCVQLQWNQRDMNASSLSCFEIMYIQENGTGAVQSVHRSQLAFNFSELLLGKAYEFSVVAVSEAGHIVARSPPSTFVRFSGFDIKMKSIPLSGAVIANYEGAEDFITLNCSILSSNEAVHIQWSLQSLKDNPAIQPIGNNTAPHLFYVTEKVIEISSNNFFSCSNLTIKNMTAELDGVVIFCGTDETPAISNFSLRLYPMANNLTVTHQSGTHSVTLHIGPIPIPFPNPSKVIIEKDGLTISGVGDITLINGSCLFFETVSIKHAGTYCYTATNYEIDSRSREVGTHKNCVTLNVIYGPELEPGPNNYYVLSEHPVSLICGYNLKSNPQATIVWTDPSGNTINDSDNIILEDGPEVIQIHIKRAHPKHNGTWKCSLHQENKDKSFLMTLIVVVSPGPPSDFSLTELGYSWAVLHWNDPQFAGNPPFSSFEIIVLHNANTSASHIVPAQATKGPTYSFNVTMLEHSCSYEFTIVAVSRTDGVLGRSRPSSHIVLSSDFRCKNPHSQLYFESMKTSDPVNYPCTKLQNLEKQLLETNQSVAFEMSYSNLVNSVLSNYTTITLSSPNPEIQGNTVSITDTKILFASITRHHSGVYGLHYSQMHGNVSKTITETGNLTLNVLYGPEIREGVKDVFSLLNDSVSLICGFKLKSNPAAQITWSDPKRNLVRNNNSSRIIQDNGEDVIRLNITNTKSTDNGKWHCSISLNETCVHRVIQGQIEYNCEGATLFSPIERDIELVVVVPPSEPWHLKSTVCGLNCIELSWNEPKEVGSPPLSRYEITYINDNGTGATVKTNKTSFKFINISLRIGYRFCVVAVSIAGNIVGKSSCSDRLQIPGLDIGIHTEPHPGSHLIHYEGSLNIITLKCTKFNDNEEIIWSLQNFRHNTEVKRVRDIEIPELFYNISNEAENYSIRSHFTIHNITLQLDEVVIFCGTNEEPLLANFTLHVKDYRPPVLKPSAIYTVMENQMNFTVSLSEPHISIPVPHYISLQKQDIHTYLGTGISVTPCDVIFHTVKRENSGNYSFHVANYAFGDQNDNCRMYSSNFTISVQYGPELLPASLEYTSLENCPVSLVCGYNLDSSPPATITWTDPHGNVLTNSDEWYSVDNGPLTVRLNISKTSKEHEGIWKCTVRVEYADGSVNTTEVKTRLIIIAPPSKPINISVNKENSSMLQLSWKQPSYLGSPNFSHYELELDGNSYSVDNEKNSFPLFVFSQISLHSLALRAVTAVNGTELNSLQIRIKMYIFGNNIKIYSDELLEKLSCNELSEYFAPNTSEFVVNNTSQRGTHSGVDYLIPHQEISIKEKTKNHVIFLNSTPILLNTLYSTSWKFWRKAMSDGESPTLVNFIALEFKEVTRGHSGIYNLTNTICDLNKCHEITASVTLDVLYAPKLHRGPKEQFVLLGSSMSLICGFQLCSNPLATTVWTHPNGRHINMSHNRYTLDSGPDVLQLNISNASEADKGMWICTVIYNDQPSLSLNLSLEVLVPSSPPSHLVIQSSHKNVSLMWRAPINQGSSLSHYEVTYVSDSGDGYTLPVNSSSTNISDLCHGTSYMFEVVAVSVAGRITGRSLASSPVYYTAPRYSNRTDPESGSLLVDFESSLNSTTFTCNIFNTAGTEQLPTSWSLKNLQGIIELQPVSTSTVSNHFYIHTQTNAYNSDFLDYRMVVLNLTTELDSVIVFCGTEGELQLANFTLRIYRSPYLKKNLEYTVVENKVGFILNLILDPLPFPTPTFHEWNTSNVNVTLKNNGVDFDIVTRKHAGIYSLTVSNYHLCDKTRLIGTDTGNFTLNVIYGPELILNEKESYVLFGYPISLVCGYNVSSNPSASIMWTNPNGIQIVHNDAYRVDSGPAVVQLNITKANTTDNGLWKCDVTVTSIFDQTDNISNNIYSKKLQVEVNLTVVVPPSKPYALSIIDMGLRTIQLQWTAPRDEGQPKFSQYEIISVGSNGNGAVQRLSSLENFFNYTIPRIGEFYEFSVVALSVAGGVVGRSVQSDPIQLSAFITGTSFYPPSGSTLADFEGANNFTTLSCTIASGDMSRKIVWSYENENHTLLSIESDDEVFLIHDNTLKNNLTIKNLTHNLDGVQLYCGTEEAPQLANWTLRIYRPPILKTNFIVRYTENSQNISVSLGISPFPFPLPSKISFEKNGRIIPGFPPFTNGITIINGSVLFFDEILRDDAGNYSVTATNYHLQNSSKSIGTSLGNFTLDVLYGPELLPAPSIYYVLVNNSISLVCGYNLNSNPKPSITWINSQQNLVQHSQLYIIDNGPAIVRLNITSAKKSDSGKWLCNCTQMLDDTSAKSELRHIHLTVLDPPNKANRVRVISKGSTWVKLQWDISLVFSNVSHYEITYIDSKGTGKTLFEEGMKINITSLAPGAAYTFMVVAVDKCGNVVARSMPTDPVHCYTMLLDFVKTKPPSGSLIADYEGKVIALNCIRFQNGHKTQPRWILRDHKRLGHGSSSNESLLLNLTSDLDREVIYCGTDDEPQLANFTLRIYRPPTLQKSRRIKVPLGTESLWVDLNTLSDTYPTPSLFKVEKRGKAVIIDNALSINTNFTIIFHKIVKEHTGTYTITAANYHPHNKHEQIGSVTSNLTIEVLYGPVITEGPGEQYAILGDPVSLICGYNLESNPTSVVTWRDAQGNVVKNSTGYCQGDGPDVVELHIYKVSKNNEGLWSCGIEVQESDVYGRNGTVSIGYLSHKIQLIVVENLKVVNVTIVEAGYTWVFLKWTTSTNGCSRILHYEITKFLNCYDINGTGVVVPAYHNEFNITNLEPDKAYDFTVTVVSLCGDVVRRSVPSDFVKFEPFPWNDIGFLLCLNTTLCLSVAIAIIASYLASKQRLKANKALRSEDTKPYNLIKKREEKPKLKLEPKKGPGKPAGKLFISNVTSNSVILSWGEPKSNPELVTGYTIFYCIANTKGTSKGVQWLNYDVVGNICTAEVRGLKSKMVYIFKVRPRGDNSSGPDSDESVATETKQSLANYVRHRSRVIERKFHEVVKPPLELLKNGKSNTFSRCQITGISKPMNTPTEKVLLLVGATGAGKSTLINGMANYIMGVCWQDDFRFKVITDEGEKSQVYSQTSSITVYSFVGTQLPYKLTVIDTPGFGDTSGIKRDKAIVNDIKELFSSNSPDGIDQIHAVGFVIQASSPRLTPTQKYIFDSVLSIFGKDIASNIFLLMTFADGHQAPVLSAINEAAIPYQQGFQFNNSALYVNQSETNNSFDEMFWNLGRKSFDLFFRELGKVEARSLQLTRETLNERQRLEAVIESLKLQIQVSLTKMNVHRQKQRILRKREAEILQKKHFTYELTVTKQRKVNLPDNVCVTNCLQCNFTCHYPCPIAKDEEKHQCKAMDGREADSACCTVCPGNCPWSQHINAPHRYELYYEVETHTSDDLRMSLSEAIEGKNQVEAMIADIEQELDLLQGAIVGMVREAKRSLERLQEIALKPNPLSETEYIDLLIKAETSEKSPGYTERIKAFEIIKTIVKEQGAVSDGTKLESGWWKLILEDKN